MKQVLWLFVGLNIGLLLCPSAAMCDLAPVVPLARGGALAPKKPHPTIRMESEDVMIRLNKRTYTVDATFLFFNTGATTTEWVGFPKRGSLTTKSSYWPPSAESEFIRFETWLDGKKVNVLHEPDTDAEQSVTGRLLATFYRFQVAVGLRSPHLPIRTERWLVHRIRFRGHTRTSIRTRYEALYASSFHSTTAYYVLGTGRHWKDSIGKAVVTIDALDVGGAGNIQINAPVACGPRVLSDTFVRIEIRNAEPLADSTLRIDVVSH